MKVFHEADAVPTNSCILLDSAEEAQAYPRGNIRLGFCTGCGFISNLAFDARLTEYSGRYEETQGFSPTFSHFHRALAERLIERHDLHNKEVIEIGCGKGEFLTLLCELGDNRGVGFDPGFHDNRISAPSAGEIRFIKDFYSEEYAHIRGDFVCCKMTLEHIQPVGHFIRTIRRALGDSPHTTVFFQVPDAGRILAECAFEDIYYEHCSYFSAGSLARLFRQSGFKILDLSSEYQSQYLTIEARPATAFLNGSVLPVKDDLESLIPQVASFADRLARKKRHWQEKLDRHVAHRHTVVIWGGGSKAVAFLSTLRTEGAINCVVDINPFRQGHYMPGSGMRIVAPEQLSRIRPDAVIIMNPVYHDEIALALDAQGLRPELTTL